MARIGEKLSPIKVRRLKAPGMYGDGRGLWLHVGPSAADSPDPLAGKSWIYRYMLRGTAREMGLGPLHTIGLAEARQRAQAARHLCLDGIDPLDQKNGKKARDALDAAKAVTFKACAAKYVASNKAGWRNAKHAAQWDATLATYVYPVIGHLPVGAIDTGHVTKILEPIWASKAETASRVRGRIESVLDFAKTHGWREGENPARWRGHLENVLPKRSKVARVEHHAALPWQEIGAFMATGKAGRRGSAGPAVRHHDSGTHRRDHRRNLGGNRHAGGRMDGARRADEGGARTSGPAVRRRPGRAAGRGAVA